MQLLGVQMLCRGVTETGARCACMLDHGLFCNAHLGQSGRYGPPNRVLLTPRANPRWVAKLRGAGVPLHERDQARIEREHVAHAEAHGRKPYGVRKDEADSGRQVFGRDAVTGVSVQGLVEELAAADYELTSAHMWRSKEDEHGSANLVLEFSCLADGKGPVNLSRCAEVGDLSLELLERAAWEAYVWANPPDGDFLVNTVRLKFRNPKGTPTCRLVWNDGFWGLALP